MNMNQQWLIAARPEGLVKESDFRWNETPLPETGDGQIRVRTVYISLDPTNRIWMNAADSYLPATKLGDVMRGGAIGVVEESRHPGFAAGDIVQGLLGWQRYSVSDGAGLGKLPKGLPVPMTAFFGLLGHIGLTAYFGLLDICQPKAGETLVVSTAAGAVGSLVGQIGKIKGLHVVGLTGSDDKCRWIKDELGYDAAINYKTENVTEALQRTCPKGIDIYFDNVGGKILEAVLNLINLRARISVCGMISQYNADGPVPGPANLANLIMHRARMEGFLCTDYMNRAEEAFTALIGWAMQGKLKYRVDVVQGLENTPKALHKLFDGSNAGKLIVQVGPE
ncbi:MAG TPA: NADP-dependent oxidoreductase [Bryobacteraceae bacterium]|nr:NADP-dependent oxidoreductase [Bryobacteraceae bacterium]